MIIIIKDDVEGYGVYLPTGTTTSRLIASFVYNDKDDIDEDDVLQIAEYCESEEELIDYLRAASYI